MKYLLWFIIIILVIRMFRRSIFISVQRNVNEQMKDHMNRQQQASQKPAGTVTIEGQKQNENGKKSDDGDYVDYEEIK